MTNVTRAPAESVAVAWRPCSLQAHLDLLRERHEDLVYRVGIAGQNEIEEYVGAVGELLKHLAGLHADDCLIRLTAEGS